MANIIGKALDVVFDFKDRTSILFFEEHVLIFLQVESINEIGQVLDLPPHYNFPKLPLCSSVK